MSKSRQPRTRYGDAGDDADVAAAAQASRAVDETQVQPASPNEIEVAGLHARPASPVDEQLWSLKTVLARTALSRSSIYSYVEQGLFPRQRRLGPRRVGWLASEVRAWIASRPV
jgi:prophage regulatory protein